LAGNIDTTYLVIKYLKILPIQFK